MPKRYILGWQILLLYKNNKPKSLQLPTYWVLCDLAMYKLSGLSSHYSPIPHSTVATLASLLCPDNADTGTLYLLTLLP